MSFLNFGSISKLTPTITSPFSNFTQHLNVPTQVNVPTQDSSQVNNNSANQQLQKQIVNDIFLQNAPKAHFVETNPILIANSDLAFAWGKEVDLLLQFQSALKSSLKPNEDSVVHNLLKKVQEQPCWGVLCKAVYDALENTNYDRSSWTFGGDAITNNPLMLLYIIDGNNNNLIEQAVNNIRGNRINLLEKLEYLLKQSPKNCKLEQVRQLFKDNYSLAQDLARIIPKVNGNDISGQIFSNCHGQDPTLLLNIQGKNWIQELKKDYQKNPQPLSFNGSNKDLNAIDSRIPYRLWSSLLRRNQLEGFATLLKQQPSPALETLQKSYKALDSSVRKNLEHYVSAAFGLPNDSAVHKILENPKMLLSIFDNQERDLITVLSTHLHLKQLHIELMVKLQEFAVNYTLNPNTKLEDLDETLRNSLAYWAWKQNPSAGDGMEQLKTHFKKSYYIFELLKTLRNQLEDSYRQQSLKSARVQSSNQKNWNDTCKDITYEHLKKEVSEDDLSTVKKVTIVTAEFQNIVSTGGLGMAVLGMAEAETKKGIKVDVVMPLFNQIPLNIKSKMVEAFRFQDEYMGKGKENRVFKLNTADAKILFPQFAGDMDNITFLFIEDTGSQNNRFGRNAIYSGGDDDLETYMYFSYCAAQVVNGTLKPDVVHAHDWSTAFVPTVLQKINSQIPSVFTIHNNLVQGKVQSDAAKTVLRHCGFKEENRNLLVDGLHSAHQVTTVSENYAEEIQSPFFGQNIQHEFRKIAFIDEKFTGIVNGTNLPQFNTSDPAIMAFRNPFSAEHENIGNQLTFGPNSTPQEIVAVKRRAKGLLQASLEQLQKDVVKDGVVIKQGIYKDVVMDFKQPYALNVGRFDPLQKGMQSFKHAVDACLASGVQIIIMGPKPADHEKEAIEHLRDLKEHCKGKKGVWIIEDEKRPTDMRFKIQQGPNPTKAFAELSTEDKEWPSNLGMIIRVGAEVGLAHSNFEPCGLTPQEFFNTGAPMIARKVGGFPNTIIPSVGVLYNPVDPYSMEQQKIMKDTITNFCNERKSMWINAIANTNQQAVEKYGKSVQEIMGYGRKLGWSDSPNQRHSPIDQYRYVYAAAKKRILSPKRVHFASRLEGKKVTLQPI